MDAEVMAEAINRNFEPPFVTEGLVKAWVNGSGRLALRIGPRDVEFDSEGNVVGAGTCLVHDHGQTP